MKKKEDKQHLKLICNGNIINLFINIEGNDSVIKTTTEKVKKEKNPMRVEQGRKLAEWNMKNKRRMCYRCIKRH